MTAFAIAKLRMTKTQWNFRGILINWVPGQGNGVRFQPVKCNMMQLTRKWVKKIHASYILEGTDLENVESIKYLGVTITNDLRWNTHVSNVCTKANRILGFLRRNLHSCPQEVKEAAYKVLVRQVLEYGSSVWDPPTRVVLQEELESVQKRTARFVTDNYKYETGSMTGILGQLKWESLKKWRKDNRLILLYKGLKCQASIPTVDLIPKTRRGRNQHSKAFQTPIANTVVYKCNFFPQTIRDGMSSPILWSHLLKLQRIVLLNSLLWWELGTNFPNHRSWWMIVVSAFVTDNYKYETGSMTGILGQLKWESLKKRRKDNRLILLYKGPKCQASISTVDLIPKTRLGRNQHSKAFQTPIANTDVSSSRLQLQTDT